MKYLCLQICCLLIFALCVNAQSPDVQLSPAFPVPADGWDKLLQLRNGNTCYFHFSKKEGIFVTIFDADRRETQRDTITGRGWDIRNMNDTEIDGIFDINGQPVIFLQQIIKGQPHLFRIIIDPHQGNLLQEDILATLSPIPGREAANAGYTASHDCFVEKDPFSDYYALACYETNTKEESSLIRLYRFNPDHTLSDSTTITASDSGHRYYSFLGMSVQNTTNISVANGCFNTSRKSLTMPPLVTLTTWKANGVTSQPLLHTQGYTDVHASMQYHPAWPELELLLMAAVPGRTDSVQLQMHYFDRNTGTLLRYQPLPQQLLSTHAQQKLAYKGAYNGLPQQLTLQADGSATILMEPMQQFLQGKNAYSRLHTSLGDAGIWQINAQGRTDSIRLVPKMQVANGAFSPLYIQRRNKGEWIFRNRIAAVHNTAYMSFDYIPLPGTHYVLYNDYLQQLDRGGKEDVRKPLRYISDANLVCYRYTPGGEEQLFLFGKPEYGKGYYCVLGAAHYNPSRQVYATIMISRNGQDQQAQLAWIRF